MAIELGGIGIERLARVAVRESARVVRHPVPGMSGDLAQALGRPSVEVEFEGILYGPRAAEELDRIRQVHLAHQPVDLFTEAVGEGYFSQVLITRFEVAQRAGYLDQFDFACEVVEYVEPPEPAAADPFGALDAGLLAEATAFVDDVQDALQQISELTDLIANIPSFGDPTERLHSMLDEYAVATGDGLEALAAVRHLF